MKNATDFSKIVKRIKNSFSEEGRAAADAIIEFIESLGNREEEVTDLFKNLSKQKLMNELQNVLQMRFQNVWQKSKMQQTKLYLSKCKMRLLKFV